MHSENTIQHRTALLIFPLNSRWKSTSTNHTIHSIQEKIQARCTTVLILHTTYLYPSTACFRKTGPFVISSHLCFDSYELHKNFQKYIESLFVVNMK